MTRAWFLKLVLQWEAPKETYRGPPRYINIAISSLLHNSTVIRDKHGKNSQLISDMSLNPGYLLYLKRKTTHFGLKVRQWRTSTDRNLEAFQPETSWHHKKAHLRYHCGNTSLSARNHNDGHNKRRIWIWGSHRGSNCPKKRWRIYTVPSWRLAVMQVVNIVAYGVRHSATTPNETQNYRNIQTHLL